MALNHEEYVREAQGTGDDTHRIVKNVDSERAIGVVAARRGHGLFLIRVF